MMLFCVGFWIMNEQKDRRGVQRKLADLDHAEFYWCCLKIYLRVIVPLRE